MPHTEVAIIVGCYKQEKYVKQAIYSAENQILPLYSGLLPQVPQDMPQWQRRVAKNPMPTIQVIVNHDNCQETGSGIAEARNLAIFHADADWIIWLDADDLLPSNYVYEMWKMVNFEKKPMLIASDVQFISGCRLDRFRSLVLAESAGVTHATHEGKLKMLLKYPMGMAAMFHKKTWRKVKGFDDKLSRGVDLDFWLRIRETGIPYASTSETSLFRRNVKPYALTFSKEEEAIEKPKHDASLVEFAVRHGIVLENLYLPYYIPSTKVL